MKLNKPADHQIEIERLKALLSRREAQLQHAYDWRYDKELELESLKRENALLIQANRNQAEQIAELEDDSRSSPEAMIGGQVNGKRACST